MRRREEILRIVRGSAVHSQDELLAALRRHGFAVTQATVSRDLRELGLVKTQAGYVEPDALASASMAQVTAFVPRETREHRLEQLVSEYVVTAEAAGNMVVIKTPVAAAQPLASAIDSTPIEGILGTIGGDDTIFIAFRTPAAAASFARRVHQIAGLAPAHRSRTRA